MEYEYNERINRTYNFTLEMLFFLSPPVIPLHPHQHGEVQQDHHQKISLVRTIL